MTNEELGQLNPDGRFSEEEKQLLQPGNSEDNDQNQNEALAAKSVDDETDVRQGENDDSKEPDDPKTDGEKSITGTGDEAGFTKEQETESNRDKNLEVVAESFASDQFEKNVVHHPVPSDEGSETEGKMKVKVEEETEDKGEEIAQQILKFMHRNPLEKLYF